MRCNRRVQNIVHLVGFRPQKRRQLRYQMKREKRATAPMFSFICWSLDKNEGVRIDALWWRTRKVRPAHYCHKHGANERTALMLRKHQLSSNLITKVADKTSNSQNSWWERHRECHWWFSGLILYKFCCILDHLVQTKCMLSNTLQLLLWDTRGQHCQQSWATFRCRVASSGCWGTAATWGSWIYSINKQIYAERIWKLPLMEFLLVGCLGNNQHRPIRRPCRDSGGQKAKTFGTSFWPQEGICFVQNPLDFSRLVEV